LLVLPNNYWARVVCSAVIQRYAGAYMHAKCKPGLNDRIFHKSIFQLTKTEWFNARHNVRSKLYKGWTEV